MFKRWVLNLIGAALLIAPVALSQLGVQEVLGTAGNASASGWLGVSISAGAYLVHWSPLLLGAAIILYANWRRS